MSKRTAPLQVMLTPDELAEIKRRAEQERQTQSEYVRGAIRLRISLEQKRNEQ